MFTPVKSTFSMTGHDYDFADTTSEIVPTKTWDFSLAPGAKPIFGGYLFKNYYNKKATSSSSASSSSSSLYADDFVVSMDVQKMLKGANGFALDGQTTNTQSNYKGPYKNTTPLESNATLIASPASKDEDGTSTMSSTSSFFSRLIKK